MKVRVCVLAIAALGLVSVVTAVAADGPFEDPSSSGTVGLFTIPRATTLGAGEVAFSLGLFYETLAREEGSANVERGGLTGAVGVTDRLEIFGSFEPRVGVRRDYLIEDALGIPHVLAPRLNDHPFAVRNFEHGLGDMRVGAKLRLAGEPRGYSGLAVSTEWKFPTASQEDGIGTGKIDIGGNVIASVEAAEAIGLNGQVGLTWKADPDEFDVANELRWGVGVQLPTRFWLQGIAEAYGVQYVNQPAISPIGFADYAILQGGVRMSFGNGLAISGGVNWNLSIDDRLGVEPEKIGSFLQVSLSSRPRRAAPPPPPLPPPKRPPSLSCRAESSTVRRGESIRISADLRNPDGNTLTVEWSASDGTLTPSTGNSVTWSSVGTSQGTATITGRATGGHASAVTCQVRVRIEDPPPPAVATVRRYTCDGFMAGSARIDNRCKAVLDDVAVMLRSNPRATVQITGHDAATGRQRNRSLSRAENAKAYLQQTHGVSASRSTVIAGSQQERKVVLELTIP